MMELAIGGALLVIVVAFCAIGAQLSDILQELKRLNSAPSCKFQQPEQPKHIQQVLPGGNILIHRRSP